METEITHFKLMEEHARTVNQLHAMHAFNK